MRCSALILLVLASGCASYTRAKIDLTAQVRRGIEITRQATIARQQVIDRLSDAQLTRLDSAFDADVNARRSLTADWVIAHRKAYALARDALNEQKQSQRQGQATIESNLATIDAALQQLQLMNQVESKLLFPEVAK